MAHEPVWVREAKTRAKGAGSPIACILFVGAMGAAFWIGTIWASQSWVFSR
ncbi:MAG TPA: hypothetical protein VGG29_12280 [Caulobacteraceae bacterium]|jgi:hypothetical protein